MLEFSVKTSDIKNILSKVTRCGVNLKEKAITEFSFVLVENGILSITTTDSTNFLTVSCEIDCDEDIYFVVKTDRFSKLIAKQSVDTITFEVNENVIVIKGNGTYKLPVEVDSDGSQIKFPKHEINTPDETGTIKIQTIKDIIFYNKSSLASPLESLDKPCLTGYYCGNGEVVTADSFNICKNAVDTFVGIVDVPPTLFDLLALCKDESVEYKIYDDRIIFESPTFKLYGILMPDDYVSSYPIRTVHDLCDGDYATECVVPKTAFLNAIDRLDLLIDPLDKDAVYLTFEEHGVTIDSMKDRGSETVAYQSMKNFKPFMCCASVSSLKGLIGAHTGESVTLMYGNIDPENPNVIKDQTITFKDGDITHVTALIDDDRKG